MLDSRQEMELAARRFQEDGSGAEGPPVGQLVAALQMRQEVLNL
jgi:hypothetical protein